MDRLGRYVTIILICLVGALTAVALITTGVIKP